jgi:hypothetical protein
MYFVMAIVPVAQDISSLVRSPAENESNSWNVQIGFLVAITQTK